MRQANSRYGGQIAGIRRMRCRRRTRHARSANETRGNQQRPLHIESHPCTPLSHRTGFEYSMAREGENDNE